MTIENRAHETQVQTKREPSRREMEELDRVRTAIEMQRPEIVKVAAKAAMYRDALLKNGFSPAEAIEIVKFTLGLLRG